MYRPLPADHPPDVLVGVLLLLTEDQAPPDRWLARAHLSEPARGDPTRQDLYLLTPEDTQAGFSALADDAGGPVVRPVLRQLLVTLRERDAHPTAGDGVPLHVADPSVRPPPLQLAVLVADREADIVGVCLEVRDGPTTIALECVAAEGDAGHWRRIDLGAFTAIRAQARAHFVERQTLH